MSILRHFIDSAYWTFTALDVARLEAPTQHASRSPAVRCWRSLGFGLSASPKNQLEPLVKL